MSNDQIAKVGRLKLKDLPIGKELYVDTDDGETFEFRPTASRTQNWTAIHGIAVKQVMADGENIDLTPGDVARWCVSPVVFEDDAVITLRTTDSSEVLPRTFKIIRMYFLPS